MDRPVISVGDRIRKRGARFFRATGEVTAVEGRYVRVWFWTRVRWGAEKWLDSATLEKVDG